MNEVELKILELCWTAGHSVHNENNGRTKKAIMKTLMDFKELPIFNNIDSLYDKIAEAESSVNKSLENLVNKGILDKKGVFDDKFLTVYFLNKDEGTKFVIRNVLTQNHISKAKFGEI